MKKATKVWLIVAACLLVVGLMISVIGLAMVGFDFANLSTQKMEVNTYMPKGAFTDIRLDVITTDIVFAPSEDGTVKVVCQEESKLKHHVQVENDTLVISQTDEKQWYDYIGFNFKSASVTVYLPETAYGDLVLKCITGDVTVPRHFSFDSAEVHTVTGDLNWNANAGGTLSLQCGTGDVKLKDVLCGDLDVKATTGDVTLIRTKPLGALNVRVATGDVTLEQVDAWELDIRTGTGDVTGTLCTGKIFTANSATGTVIMPSKEQIKVIGMGPGKCNVETGTGDIRLELAD